MAVVLDPGHRSRFCAAIALCHNTNDMNNAIETKIESNHNWYKKWFDTSFYHNLYKERNEKDAADFLTQLIDELAPLPAANILDLGCGNGRHSRWLAQKGFNVTGIDLAASSIQQAKRFESSALRFYRADMLRPFGNNDYDYIFNFFTSFGYFDSDEKDKQVCRNIFQALRPGGKLMIDYINAEYATKHLVTDETKEIDGALYKIHRWVDDQFIYKQISIADPLFGKPFYYTEQVKRFSQQRLTDLLEQQGLFVEKVFGDYHLNSFNPSYSPRIILIATKIKS